MKTKKKILTVSQLIKLFSHRIDNGVKYLNRNKPGWYNKIVLDDLDLKYGHTCIVGQVFGHFWNRVLDKEEKPERNKMAHAKAVERGFILEETKDNEYDLLTRLWWLRVVSLRNKLAK